MSTGADKDSRVTVMFPGNKGLINCVVTELSRTAPPTTLPGGYSVGDGVFYTGASQTLPSSNRVKYGGTGEVMGPGFGADKDSCVTVMFPGNKGLINRFVTELSRTAPPTTLPGGYSVGDEVFYTAWSHTFSNGDCVKYGGTGEVVGPGEGADKDSRITIMFPGNRGNISCLVTKLSRAAPPTLPGGYSVGDEVTYTAGSHAFLSGGRLVHGSKGKVVGLCYGDCAYTHVAVQFPKIKGGVNCLLANLSRTVV